MEICFYYYIREWEYTCQIWDTLGIPTTFGFRHDSLKSFGKNSNDTKSYMYNCSYSPKFDRPHILVHVEWIFCVSKYFLKTNFNIRYGNIP